MTFGRPSLFVSGDFILGFYPFSKEREIYKMLCRCNFVYNFLIYFVYASCAI